MDAASDLQVVKYVVTPEREFPVEVEPRKDSVKQEQVAQFPMSNDTVSQVGATLDIPRWMMRANSTRDKFRTSPIEFNKLYTPSHLTLNGGWRTVLEAFASWDSRCKAAVAFANRLEATWEPHLDKWVASGCDSFVFEAEYLGWRKALSMFFGRASELGSHEETIAWAKVQQRCCSIYAERHDQFDAHFFIDDSWERIRDLDVFRVAYPLLYQQEIPWKPWFKLAASIGYGHAAEERPWELDGRYYVAWEMNCDEACRVVVQQAWKEIRTLDGTMRPVEPDSVAGPVQTIRELDKVILWCEQMVEKGLPQIPSDQAKKKLKPSLEEYNQLAREYLKKNPEAGPTEIRRALKCGVGTVYKLPAVQAVRGELSKGKKPKAVSLTPEMASVVTQDSEMARLIREQRRDDRSSRVLAGDRE